MKTLLRLALLLCIPLSMAAQTEAPEPQPAACAAALAKPFDGGLDPHVPPDCDSAAYYYGIGRDKDYVAARVCALIERYNKADKDGSLFTGAGILSMVYANGEGTPRDVDLAKRFTCEIKEAAFAETDARLKLLDKIALAGKDAPGKDAAGKDLPPKEVPRFDLCKTASNGTSWGWCESIELRLHDAKRYDTMVAIVNGLTPQGVEAFKALQTAEGDFETLRSEKEIDLTGAARGAWTLQEQDRLRAQFVNDLKLFSTPDYAQPVTLAVVDALVNKDLASIRTNGAKIFQGTTITVAGIEETQRAWLKYRAAWLAYEGVVNPTLSSDAVATQISRERLTHLHKLNTTF
jgi:hypothetical protein